MLELQRDDSKFTGKKKTKRDLAMIWGINVEV